MPSFFTSPTPYSELWVACGRAISTPQSRKWPYNTKQAENTLQAPTLKSYPEFYFGCKRFCELLLAGASFFLPPSRYLQQICQQIVSFAVPRRCKPGGGRRMQASILHDTCTNFLLCAPEAAIFQRVGVKLIKSKTNPGEINREVKTKCLLLLVNYRISPLLRFKDSPKLIRHNTSISSHVLILCKWLFVPFVSLHIISLWRDFTAKERLLAFYLRLGQDSSIKTRSVQLQWNISQSASGYLLT